MSRPKPPTYCTTNWHDYNAARARRGSLAIWSDPESQWLAGPTGKRGRRPVFTDAAIQTCLTLKALFGLPLRQTTGMVASLLDLAGLDWSVPDFSTLCRRHKTLTVHIPYRPGTGALHLSIDSTSAKAEGDGEWLARKYGPSKPRDWRKMHPGIDVETLEVRAVEVTGSRVGDAPDLPDRLDQIAEGQSIGMATALTELMTPALVTPPPQRAGPPPSFRPAETASHGRNRRRVRSCETMPFVAAATSVERSGSAGPATSDEVWSKARYGASSCWASASFHATSSGRSPSFRSGPSS